jgi:hypothetical protein
MEPATVWTLEFSARTRSKYDDKDAAATFGFGSIILWIASVCALKEGAADNDSNVTAMVIAKYPGPLSSRGSGAIVVRALP